MSSPALRNRSVTEKRTTEARRPREPWRPPGQRRPQRAARAERRRDGLRGGRVGGSGPGGRCGRGRRQREGETQPQERRPAGVSDRAGQPDAGSGRRRERTDPPPRGPRFTETPGAERGRARAAVRGRVRGEPARRGATCEAGGYVRRRADPKPSSTPSFALRCYQSSRPAKATRGHEGACHHPASGRRPPLRTLEDTSVGSSTLLCSG